MKDLILSYIKTRLLAALLLLVCYCLLLFVFWLGDLLTFTVWYAFILCGVAVLAFMAFDFYRYQKLHKQLVEIRDAVAITIEHLPKSTSIIMDDYTALLKEVNEAKEALELSSGKTYKDLVDYYTLWVHQIKTPIAAMRLLLQTNESESSAELELELLKIEQYVSMALSYIRIDSNESDLILHEHSIDSIIKPILRKNAKMFIRKKLSLVYDSVNIKTITDEKWLSFVIEQIISNSLKYTNEGEIRIYSQDDATLVIEDSGIGIAPEDLPRVFDKNYTGYNGHSDKKATGLGLYLCKKALYRLGHSISIDSTPGVGTKVAINLKSYDLTPND